MVNHNPTVAAQCGKTQTFLSERVQNINKRMTEQANVTSAGFVVSDIIVHKGDLQAITEIEIKSLERAMA